jgi:hypothetical protein
MLIFYHYIYLEYNALVSFDKEFHELLMEIYHEKKNTMSD